MKEISGSELDELIFDKRRRFSFEYNIEATHVLVHPIMFAQLVKLHSTYFYPDKLMSVQGLQIIRSYDVSELEIKLAIIYDR